MYQIIVSLNITSYICQWFIFMCTLKQCQRIPTIVLQNLHYQYMYIQCMNLIVGYFLGFFQLQCALLKGRPGDVGGRGTSCLECWAPSPTGHTGLIPPQKSKSGLQIHVHKEIGNSETQMYVNRLLIHNLCSLLIIGKI